MGGKGDAPDPPDMTAMANASVESAEIWSQVAREQMDWAREVDAANRETLNRVLGVQLPQLEAAFQQAQDDRRRYVEVFQPIEDNLIQEFQEYDTLERREQEAAERVADVRTQFDAQRRNAQQQLEDYGIDPSQTRFQALDRNLRAQEAAASALSANQGRESVEQMGRALRGEAINIGRGLPSQVAQAQGIVNQTAGGAVQNAGNTTNAGVNAFGSAGQYAQLGQQGYNQGASIMNAGYQNQMAQYNANSQSNSNLWSGIGSMAGMAVGGPLGAAAGGALFGAAAGGEDGGSVPEDLAPTPGPTDRIPAMLAEDEFVIPADVVKKKGTEFFDKLLDKYRDGGDYDGKREELRQAIG